MGHLKKLPVIRRAASGRRVPGWATGINTDEMLVHVILFIA